MAAALLVIKAAFTYDKRCTEYGCYRSREDSDAGLLREVMSKRNGSSYWLLSRDHHCRDVAPSMAVDDLKVALSSGRCCH
jgi:hypothetical protein